MIASGQALADAAAALVGCPFRLHGRDPAAGLDCVGLVFTSLQTTGANQVVPVGYALRNLSVDHWLPLARQSGLESGSAPIRAGDVLLLALAYAQHHLVIAADTDNVIHAHAGLRRVVRQPLDPAWRVSALWRIAAFEEG